MLRHINVKKLCMSILLCNFAVEKVTKSTIKNVERYDKRVQNLSDQYQGI